MGNIPNTNPKYKPKKLTKMQVQIACIKVKAHLQLVKDRKVNQLMKDEKVLVGMLNAKSRNKVEEVLQAEKVISDLKFIQACTTLMAYANTLKNHSAVIAESQGNPLNLTELIPYILSIIYASSHLGLSSLNEFKMLMMNYFGTENVQLPLNQIDPKIIQSFKVNSTPFELNTYFIEMSERNNIPLETINAIGHNINRHYTGPVNNNVQNNPNQNNPYQNNHNQNNPYQNNQNQNQFNPQQQQPHAQQNVYGGNPYRNSVNFDGPAFNPNNNNVQPNNFNNNQNNNNNLNYFNNNQNGNNFKSPTDFNYPTEEFSPFNNKAYDFDTKPIDIPTYNPNQIPNQIAHGMTNNPTPAVINTIVAPKPLQTDPYANLLNINQIDDIPLYPQMQRLSLNPNKNKPADISLPDAIKNNYDINNPAFKPYDMGFDDNIKLNVNNNNNLGITTKPSQFNYSPEYVPYNADYQPTKAAESIVYPKADFKDYSPFKPELDNFNLNLDYNTNNNNNINNNNYAKPQDNNNFDNINYNQGYNPYGGTTDPGFDKICEEIRKGL